MEATLGVGNLRRWQKNIHFLLATLKVAYVLSTPLILEQENEIVDQMHARAKWKNDDYICCGYILNSMSDPLLDTYQVVSYAKELWDLLGVRYMKEDATSKKFLVSHFNVCAMRDDRSIMEQFIELERILGHFKMHNMNMNEPIIVSSIIDKLPPS